MDIDDNFNCSLRYMLNSTNLDSMSVLERYSNCELKQVFMPNLVGIVRIFIFIWLISGVFGNSISFFVWHSKRQRHKNSSAIYLAALSLTDLLLIILLFNYYLEQYWCLRGIIHMSGICQIYQSLFIFTQYYSIVLVFGFTLERYIAVCFPFKRHKLCTNKRALIAILILSLFVFIPMICQTIIWEFNKGECRMRMNIVQNEQFQTLIFSQEVLFSLIVPLATLVLNILVLNEMRRLIQSQKLSKFIHPNYAKKSGLFVNFCHKKPNLTLDEIKQTTKSLINTTDKTNKKDSNCYSASQSSTSQTISQNFNYYHQKSNESSNFLAATLMLIILSFYLIACSVPTGIVYILQFKWIQPDECLSDEAIKNSVYWTEFLMQIKTKDIVDTICASHYACNFFIYFITCSDFRKQIINVFKFKFKFQYYFTSENGTGSYMPMSRRTKPRIMKTISTDSNNLNIIKSNMKTNNDENKYCLQNKYAVINSTSNSNTNNTD